MHSTAAENRKAFIRRVKKNTSLEDYNEERRKQWDTFSSDDQKKIKESIVFVSFATDSGLVTSPLEHVNEDPPLPDIRSEIGGQPYYFELGEITDEGLARGVSDSEKCDEIKGGPFSQSDQLLKMVRGKCAKSYSTRVAPVDLLLYYSKQHPDEEHLFRYLKVHQATITQLIARSPFSRVWIYRDWSPGKVLWQTAR